MELIKAFGLLLVGFLLLIKGADYFVEGTSKMAIKMHVPEIVVGLTIVAMGTSAPEAAISITAALNNNAGISIGNVVGSNIMNVALILGLSALIAKLPIKKNTLKIEIPFTIAITVVLCAIGYFAQEINRMGAAVLVVLFIMFLSYLLWLTKHGQDGVEEVEPLSEKDTFLRLAIISVLGVVAIVVGSDLTVDSATVIAQYFGLSQRVIGLTIVAFGTSLPELVTSVTAARRGNTDIAIGNIVGSNIFNILFVLGVSGLVSPSPIPFTINFVYDGLIAILVLVMLFGLSYKKQGLSKVGGAIFLVSYLAYVAYLLIA